MQASLPKQGLCGSVFAIMEQTLVLGQLLALLTAFCWTQNSIIYRHLGSKIGSDTVAHIRMWIALPMILLMTYFTEGIWFPTPLSPRTYLLTMASGALGYFITDLMLFKAYVLIGNREAMVIMTLSPVATAIFGFGIFGEYLNVIQVLGIAVTLGGVAIAVLMGRQSSNEEGKDKKAQGYVLAILASVMQAVSYVFVKFTLEETGPVSTNLLRNLGGLACFFLHNGLVKRNVRQQVAAVCADRKFVILLFCAAFAGPVLGMSCQMTAFTLAPSGIVTTITQATPIILIPYDYFVLKKKLGASSLLGTVVSIVGVALLFLSA